MNHKDFEVAFTHFALESGVSKVEFRKSEQVLTGGSLIAGNYSTKDKSIWVVTEYPNAKLSTSSVAFLAFHELGHFWQHKRGDGIIFKYWESEEIRASLELDAHRYAQRKVKQWLRVSLPACDPHIQFTSPS